MDLLERIQHWGETAPDRVAHISGEKQLTYGELWHRSDIVAAALLRSFPDDHLPIAVYGHKEPEMLIGFLGAIKAGHPYLPIDCSIPPQRVQSIIASSGAVITLTPELVADMIRDLPSVSITMPTLLAPNDPFYIIFTSGSTGDPKGVVITYGCLTSFLEWMLREHIFVEAGEIFLNQAPFSFDLSVMDLYLSLAVGGTLFSISKKDISDPMQLYRTLVDSGTTTWVSTPSFAQLCLAEPSFDAHMLPHLRRFLFCGETLSPEVASVLIERFPDAQVWNTYGPTEATVATTSVRINRALLEKYATVPVGYPKPDTHVLIVDDNGNGLSSGERGEIIIVGSNVSPGYLGRPDLNAASFFAINGQRAYRTGDWGLYREGLLFCEGRRDNQIKLHGHRIELGDVEAHLKMLPGVRDGVVVAKVKDGRADHLVAFVVLTHRPEGSDFVVVRVLRSQLADYLPGYMLPQQFYFLQSMPMTTNGKTDRNKLMEMLA